jgi:hypothetical protein
LENIILFRCIVQFYCIETETEIIRFLVDLRMKGSLSKTLRLVFWREMEEKRVDEEKFSVCYLVTMARQRIPTTTGEVFGVALIAMVVMAVGFLPRMMASSGVMDLRESQKAHQSASCTPTPTPPPAE